MEGVVEPEGDFAGASAVMVDWEEEREKVFASGARCVSFNSAVCQRHNVGIECWPTAGSVGRVRGQWRRHTLGELPRHGSDGCRTDLAWRVGGTGRCGWKEGYEG